MKLSINRPRFLDARPTLPVAFMTIGLLFGIIFAFSTPLLWGVDETTHFARVYQLTDGQLRASYLGDQQQSYAKEGYGGHVPANLLQLIVLVNDNLRNPGFNSVGVGWVKTRAVYNHIAGQSFSNQKVPYSFTNTAAYAPTAYLPSVLAVTTARLLHFSIANTIHLARLATLLFYLLSVGWALYILRGLRAQLLIFAVGLMPATLYQASIVSADGVINSLALLFSALFIKAVIAKKALGTIETSSLLIILIVLPTTKPTYIILDVLGLLIPSAYLAGGRYKSICKFLAIGCGVLGFVGWTYLTRNVAATIGLMGPSPWQLNFSHLQLYFMLGHPLSFIVVVLRSLLLQDNTYFMQLFGWFSFSNLQVPAISVISSIIALGLSVLITDKDSHFERRKLLLTAVILLAAIVSVFATLYITFTPVAYPVVRGVQGRYFIPFLVLGLVVISKLIPFRIAFEDLKSRRSVTGIVGGLVCLSLAGSAIKFIYVIWG